MASEEIKIVKSKSAYEYNPRKSGKLLNGKDMAEFAGISEQAFHRNWIAQGCPSVPNPARPSEKCYPSAMVMKWRFDKDSNNLREKLIGQVEISEGEMTIIEAERRKKQADALLSEFALADKQALVANIDDIMHNVGTACSGITSTLLGWRANLPGLLTMQDEDAISKILSEEVSRILKELNTTIHEYKPSAKK